MGVQYQYKYAYIRDNGLCTGTQDSTDYILSKSYVPIEDDSLPYLMKYYHPIPEEVTSFDSWQGKWYSDANFTVEVPELNG